MSGFTDLAAVKGVLGIPLQATKGDDAIEAALEAACATVLQCLCLDQVEVKAYTVFADLPKHGHHFDHVDAVIICPRPVQSVTEVKDGDTVLDTDDYKLLSGYYLKRCCGVWGRHCRGRFSNGCNVIEATVQAGFPLVNGSPDVPKNLAYGVAQFAAAIYSNPTGIQTQKIGRFSQTFRDVGPTGLPPMPPMLVDALSAFTQEFAGYVPIAQVAA